MPRPNEIVLSVFIGILTSLGAQGIWNVIFAWVTGSFLDQVFSASLLLIIVAFGLDLGVIFWLRSILRKSNSMTTKSDGVEITKILETILTEQEKVVNSLKRLENEFTAKKIEKDDKKPSESKKANVLLEQQGKQ